MSALPFLPAESYETDLLKEDLHETVDENHLNKKCKNSKIDLNVLMASKNRLVLMKTKIYH